MEMGVAGVKAALASRRRCAALLAPLVLLALPALALAHLERPSYWPDPRPDKSVSPPAGGKVPHARSLKSAVSGAGRATCSSSARAPRARESLAGSCAHRSVSPHGGLPPPSEPAEDQALQAPGAAAARHQRRAGDAVRLPLGPVGGSRRRQQRPDPDHAGPLHRAGLAASPNNDPKCNPSLLQRDASGDLTPSYEYQVDLSQRPEPDLRPGPRGHGRSASAPAFEPPGDPGARAGPVRAVQPADRGHRAEARGRDHGRRHRLSWTRARPARSREGPAGEAERLRQARRPASRPRRRLRRAQLPRAAVRGNSPSTTRSSTASCSTA